MYFQLFIRRRCFTIICFIILTIFIWFYTNSKDLNDEINKERIRNLIIFAENQSFCSKRSARRGFNQYVLSVSAYESNDNVQLETNRTWSYIITFVNEAKKFYPSWTVRVYYYDLRNKTKDDIENLEQLYDNLDFCNVKNLPVLGNLKNKLPGKIQRFLPSVDPLVDVTMVRDLDSEIFERETLAVKQWLKQTTYAFHIMRDHYSHNIPILGGLWGVASNRLSIDDRLTIATALLPSNNEKDIRQFMDNYSDRGDQDFLTDYIWPLARRNSLTHDSFTCLWSYYIYRTDTRPFPTERKHPSCFVGCPKPCCTQQIIQNKDFSSQKQCPFACRPKRHKDWLFC